MTEKQYREEEEDQTRKGRSRGKRQEKTGKEAGKKNPTNHQKTRKNRQQKQNKSKIKINKEKGQGKKQKIKNRSKNPKINPTKDVGPACSLSTGPAGLPLATVLRLHLSGRQVSGQTHRSIRWRHASHRWPESHLSTRTAVISPEWLVGILYKGPKTLYWASNQAKRDLSS